MNIRRREVTGIHILIIAMLMLGIGGGVHRLVTEILRGHRENLPLGAGAATLGIHSSMAYHPLRLVSDYKVIVKKDLFQPLYSLRKNLSSSKPSSEKSIVKTVAKTEPRGNRKLDIGIVVTGIVMDDQRTLALVENIKSRECKFVAPGESVFGLRLVNIKANSVLFDDGNHIVKVTLGVVIK